MGTLALTFGILSVMGGGFVAVTFYLKEKNTGKIVKGLALLAAIVVVNALIWVYMLGPRRFDTKSNRYGGVTYTTKEYYMNYSNRNGWTVRSGFIPFFGSCRLPEVFPTEYVPRLLEADIKGFTMEVSQNETVVTLEAQLTTKAGLEETIEAYGAHCKTWGGSNFKEYHDKNEYVDELLSGRYSFVQDGHEFTVIISPEGGKTKIKIEMEKIDKSVASLNG